jgi:hypothetical protein
MKSTGIFAPVFALQMQAFFTGGLKNRIAFYDTKRWVQHNDCAIFDTALTATKTYHSINPYSAIKT